jgi:hypothetical protein
VKVATLQSVADGRGEQQFLAAFDRVIDER